jgi:hypothetical protein
LDLLFAQTEVEGNGNRIGALAQLFSQIALADDNVTGNWEAASQAGLLKCRLPWLGRFNAAYARPERSLDMRSEQVPDGPQKV